MKLIATMPVRNEAWVIGLSARVALMWCDELVILNHRSTDNTVPIVADIQRQCPGRVHLISTPDEKWLEMRDRELMLDLARGKGATHIAIVDADEILTGNLLDRKLFYPEAGTILQLPGYNLRGGLWRYHANGTWGARWFSTVFKTNERLYWSQVVSGRGGEDAHHHREPFGMKLEPYRPVRQGDGGVMHLWGANARRLRAKHAWYKMQERLKWPEKNILEIDSMYSWFQTGCRPGEPFDWQFQDVPKSWWAPYESLMCYYLDLDAYPWQVAECKALYERHGAETFKGLDLFGIVG